MLDCEGHHTSFYGEDFFGNSVTVNVDFSGVVDTRCSKRHPANEGEEGEIQKS